MKYLKKTFIGFINVTYKNLQLKFKLKVKMGSMGENIKNIQIIENLYDSRNEAKFRSRNASIATYGIETVSFAAPGIWSNIPRK